MEKNPSVDLPGGKPTLCLLHLLGKSHHESISTVIKETETKSQAEKNPFFSRPRSNNLPSLSDSGQQQV